MRERSAQDELLRQQQQLFLQEEAQRTERPASLEQIAWQMRREATGELSGLLWLLWPPGGAPGPGMQF